VAPGTPKSITVTYTVPASTPAGNQTNSATVHSPTDPSDSTANDTNTVTTLADLTISKSHSPEPVLAGTQVTYTITVHNSGPSDAKSVTVSDTMPGGLMVASVSSSQGGCAALPCNLGTLAAGGTATVTVVANTPAANANVASRTVTNTASVSSSTTLTNPGDDTTTNNTTIKRPLVTVSKSVDKSQATVLDQLTYTLTTTNDSAGATAYNIVVKDTLPTNTVYVSGSATTGVGITTEYSANGTTWFATEAGAGGAANIHYVRWTILTLTAGGNKVLSLKANVKFPTAPGTVLVNSGSVDNYCSTMDSSICYSGNTSTASTTIVLVGVGSTSTITDSSFLLKDDLSPWTISDFEILLSPKNVVVATNPGQFYYHQRVTNTFGSTTSMDFTLNWPSDFVTQTVGGQPLHAYVQYASDPANTWRDWTSQSTGICWSPTPTPACTGNDGTITVNNVPAGAKVWITAHLDYNLKGTTQASTFTKKPILYAPFKSYIVIKDQTTGVPVGASTSSESLLGRGKKVTVVYGVVQDQNGNPINHAWVRLDLGGRTAWAATQVDGSYVFYDGQLCDGSDGLESCSGATSTPWTFPTATTTGTLKILGDAQMPVPSNTTGTLPAGLPSVPTYPSGKSQHMIAAGATTLQAWTSNPPTHSISIVNGNAYDREWSFRP
ncbi:MAG TPA: DUF11 domain-containing protein, partial [Actinomycetota bacterium]|nr:DUF11 domain-containing protein [Actinomycetota bacterium]